MMRRLPGMVCKVMRPGHAVGSCIVSQMPAPVCCDTVCVAASVGHASTSAPLASAGCIVPATSPLLQGRQPSLIYGEAAQLTATGMPLGMSLRGMRTAAAAGLQSVIMPRAAFTMPLMAARQLATAAQQAAEQPSQHQGISEVTAVKVVKYVVIGMIIVLTVRVMPYMGVGTVQSALQLLTAESPFLQKAGAQRLSALAGFSDAGALAAIDGDAVPKLLHLLKHSDDQGVKREVTNALLQLAKVPKGETALLLAEAPLICMLVLDTGDIDDKTTSSLHQLVAQLESAVGRGP